MTYSQSLHVTEYLPSAYYNHPRAWTVIRRDKTRSFTGASITASQRTVELHLRLNQSQVTSLLATWWPPIHIARLLDPGYSCSSFYRSVWPFLTFRMALNPAACLVQLQVSRMCARELKTLNITRGFTVTKLNTSLSLDPVQGDVYLKVILCSKIKRNDFRVAKLVIRWTKLAVLRLISY